MTLMTKIQKMLKKNRRKQNARLKKTIFQEKKNTKKQTQPLTTETATQRQTKMQLS